METLERLGQRIETIGEIRNLVHTLKTLASVNLRQFQLAQTAMDASLETNRLGLQVLLRHGLTLPDVTPAAPLRVVFGAERGFCGRYSDRLIDAAGPPDNVIAVGTRLVAAMEHRGLAPRACLAAPASAHGIGDVVTRILDVPGLQGRESLLEAVFMTRTSGAGLDRRISVIWPADISPQAPPWPSPRSPYPLGDPHALLDHLLAEHRRLHLHSACLQAMIAESAARLSAMRAAEENIDRHLDALDQARRLRRQEAITTELLDIWSGYALTQPAP